MKSFASQKNKITFSEKRKNKRNMRNKKKMMEKICALVFTIILINMTFAFAISLQIPTVAAASGTCIQNRAGTNFCYESASEPNDCYLWRDGKTVDQVDECKLGTCVPAGNGACIENKAKASCEYNNGGRWYDSTKDNVADCNTGCCVAPNKAECLTSEEKAVCVKKGYTWDTKSEQECKNVCGAVEYGCCNDAGIFTNKHRSECAGTFYGNAIYCSQVIGSGIQSCKDVKCGDLIGFVGSTGKSSAPHLHYEVLLNGVPQDPENYLGKGR